MNKDQLDSAKEQIQEDILTYLEAIDPEGYNIPENDRDQLCQIVVNNFKALYS